MSIHPQQFREEIVRPVLEHLDAAATLTEDLRGSDEWIALVRRQLTTAVNTPKNLRPFSTANAWFAPLSWFGLGGLNGRMHYCGRPWVVKPWSFVRYF